MRYYIIAGEASGDLHGSNLMKGLYAEDENAIIRFWGGELMNNVYSSCSAMTDGGGLVKDYREGAVMGAVEVLKKARTLTANMDNCKKDILAFNPDVIILIDYPGFNLRIASWAHKHGMKVFYYIAPKVWASREGRCRQLKKYIDKLFIVFPFEQKYFTSKGIDYIYRGNPLVDAVKDSPAMKEPQGENSRTIALLAGSRIGEVRTMMPEYVAFARKMHALPQYADYKFIVAGAPGRTPDDYDIPADVADYMQLVFWNTQEVVRKAEAAVINSGTASLEAVLLDTPQVVGYKFASKLTYLIANNIIKVPYISLGNLCIDKFAFQELRQDNCNADNLVAEIRHILEDEQYRAQMKRDYAQIRESLGDAGASRAVAKAMVELLK